MARTASSRRRKSASALDITKYRVPEEKMSRNQKAAHFLNWAADHYPYQYVQYNILLKAIMGYRRLPRLDTDEVLMLRRSMCGVKVQLYKLHSRILDTQPGMGVRALVDDADNLRVDAPKKMKRLVSSKMAVERTLGMIDPRNIPDTPEMKPLKKWLKNDVGGILSALSRADFDVRALPPAKGDDQ